MEALEQLEQTLHTLMQRYADLQRENAFLREANETQRLEMMRTHRELIVLKEKNRHLTEANALLGSPDERIEARRRLAALVAKVDKAIEQLKQ